MSTRQATPVLGFSPPSELRDYAHIAVFAETREAFETVRRRVVDAGLTVSDRVVYDTATGQPIRTCSWNEDKVWCSLHAPRDYHDGVKSA